MIQRFFGRKKDSTTPANLAESSLGRVLVRLHILTEDQLSKVLERDVAGDETKIGEVACELGFCTPADIEQAVTVQADIRGGREGVASLAFLSSSTEKMVANAAEIGDRVQSIKKSPKRISIKRS